MDYRRADACRIILRKYRRGTCRWHSGRSFDVQAFSTGEHRPGVGRSHCERGSRVSAAADAYRLIAPWHREVMEIGCRFDEAMMLDLANDIRSLSDFKRNTVDLLNRVIFSSLIKRAASVLVTVFGATGR